MISTTIKNTTYGLLIVSLFIFSCEKKAVGIKIPDESKLVISAFISPDDDTISVYVEESISAFSKTTKRPDDAYPYATVELSDGENTITLSYKEYSKKINFTIHNYKVYCKPQSSSFKIDYGKTYYLKVSAPDGRVAKASCTVPEKINYTSEVQFKVEKDNTHLYSDGNYTVLASWIDIPDKNNYYRLIDVRLPYEYPCKDIDGSICKNIDGSPLYYSGSEGTNWDRSFISDEGHQGSTLKLNGSYSIPSVWVGGSPIEQKDIKFKPFQYRLINMDEHFYKYLENNARYVEANQPFIEPISIYSNIEGGLGIFGSYTVLVDKSK